MPDFYAVPYPTSQDPGVTHPRRSRTSEYRRLVAEPCKAGKLSVAGYRWAAYLYGGESCVSLRTYTTTTRYDSLLARRQGDCEAFRQTLHEEGYNGLPDRDVEYNIFIPHNLLPDLPIGRSITEAQAKSLISRYPIPCWINRDSPLYRGWDLYDATWKGEQTLEDLGLTEEDEQEHMTDSSAPNFHENPPSPYSHGPSPNHRHRGTPRNRRHNMPPKDQARNPRGQFVRQDKEIMVTAKEATAAIFAAAALTHMAENPSMYPAEWTTGAKTNKAAILTLATKLSDEAQEPQSPADVLRRLNLGSGLSTPSRKRKLTVSLLGDDEEDSEPVYPTAPKFSLDNPFASPAKKKADVARSEKSNPAAIATLLETKNFYVDLTTFMSKFGDIVNLEFDPRCPAVADLLNNRPAQRDEMLDIEGQRVAAVFVHDKYATASLVPGVLFAGLYKAVDTLRNFDPDNKTDCVPVSFILHGLLRMNRDFGVVKIRYTDDNQFDRPSTIRAWKTKYGQSLTATSYDAMRNRVAGLVDYVKTHGVVKCHALTDSEVDLVAAGVADDAMEAIWGDAGNARVGGNAADID